MLRALVNKSVMVRGAMATQKLTSSRGLFQVSEGKLEKGEYKGFEENLKFKETLKADFKANGLKNVFVGDIGYLGKLAIDGKDLEFMREAIASAAGNDVLTTVKADITHRAFYHFIQACHRLDNVEEAMKAWTDPVFKATYLPIMDTPESYKAAITYLDLLLNNGMYDELLDFYEKNQEELINQAKPTLLAILGCYKKGTYEALLKGIKILKLHESAVPMRQAWQREKMIVGMADLACTLQEYSLANVILEHIQCTDKQGREPFIHSSMFIIALARSGRLDKAIDMMSEKFMPRGGTDSKRKVLYSAIESLVAKASEHEDGKKLNEVMDMVAFIEQHADVETNNIEEILFSPMDFASKPPSTNRRGEKTSENTSTRGEKTNENTSTSLQELA